MLHAAKRVKSLEQTDSDVTVAFEDGTDAHFDAVIGADGIFSSVRNHVVGEEPERYAASPAGWWDCRHLVPFEKARAALGDESFKVDRQYAWLGDGAAMLHGIVENRTMIQCIIAVIDKKLSTDRKRSVTRQVLEDALPASWYEGPVAKGMVEVSSTAAKQFLNWNYRASSLSNTTDHTLAHLRPRRPKGLCHLGAQINAYICEQSSLHCRRRSPHDSSLAKRWCWDGCRGCFRSWPSFRQRFIRRGDQCCV